MKQRQKEHIKHEIATIQDILDLLDEESDTLRKQITSGAPKDIEKGMDRILLIHEKVGKLSARNETDKGPLSPPSLLRCNAKLMKWNRTSQKSRQPSKNIGNISTITAKLQTPFRTDSTTEITTQL